MTLTPRYTQATSTSWGKTALANIDACAFDHPAHDHMRAAIIELDATSDRLKQIADKACGNAGITYAAKELQWLAAEIVSDARTWDDERPSRIVGNKLDTSRAWSPRDLGRE